MRDGLRVGETDLNCFLEIFSDDAILYHLRTDTPFRETLGSRLRSFYEKATSPPTNISGLSSKDASDQFASTYAANLAKGIVERDANSLALAHNELVKARNNPDVMNSLAEKYQAIVDKPIGSDELDFLHMREQVILPYAILRLKTIEVLIGRYLRVTSRLPDIADDFYRVRNELNDKVSQYNSTPDRQKSVWKRLRQEIETLNSELDTIRNRYAAAKTDAESAFDNLDGQAKDLENLLQAQRTQFAEVLAGLKDREPDKKLAVSLLWTYRILVDFYKAMSPLPGAADSQADNQRREAEADLESAIKRLRPFVSPLDVQRVQ